MPDRLATPRSATRATRTDADLPSEPSVFKRATLATKVPETRGSGELVVSPSFVPPFESFPLDVVRVSQCTAFLVEPFARVERAFPASNTPRRRRLPCCSHTRPVSLIHRHRESLCCLAMSLCSRLSLAGFASSRCSIFTFFFLSFHLWRKNLLWMNPLSFSRETVEFDVDDLLPRRHQNPLVAIREKKGSTLSGPRR